MAQSKIFSFRRQPGDQPDPEPPRLARTQRFQFDDPAIQVLIRAMEMRDLAKALAQLAPEYREVVLLIGLEQMRYEDVAEILDVPLGTVMSRLSRGRERLRALMSGEAQPVLRRVK